MDDSHQPFTDETRSESTGDHTEPHRTGEPDTLPTTFCRKCEVDVKPVGKGQCPRCGAFLRLNFVARQHVINKLRVEQILDELIIEFRPTTTTERRACKLLAVIYEQLEAIRPGSAEWSRQIEKSIELKAELKASRAERDAQKQPTDVTNLTTDQLAERARNLVTLAETVRANQKKFDETNNHPLIHGEADGDAASLDRAIAREQQVLDDLRAEAARESQETALVVETSPEKCQWCGQTPCVGRDHHAYDVLHANDPEHVEARNARETAEMYESLRRQRY